MSLCADLHCHSVYSDGTLLPAELVRRAVAAGVELLSLTDHDATGGLEEAAREARACSLGFLPGIELSTTWAERNIHVVGLGIDPDQPLLREGIARIAEIRLRRAEAIAGRLGRAGIPDTLNDALALAGPGTVTRSHFARCLLARGQVGNLQQAFDRYLGRGKPAHVCVVWISIEEAVQWIQAAGGVPVLAHPLRYGLSGAWTRRLLEAFRSAGGKGLEVISGPQHKSQTDLLADHAMKHGFLASCGSDFHTPDQRWCRLGMAGAGALPAKNTPVWSVWPEMRFAGEPG